MKSELPEFASKAGGLSLRQSRLKEIRDYLVLNGLDECVTYSLLSEENSHKFNLLHQEEHYKLLNPLTDEREYFRTHITYSLLEAALYNYNRQNKDLSLFETANMMSRSSKAEHLSIVLLGNELQQDMMKKVPYDFYHMKGLVEGVFSLLGIEASRYKFERYVSEKEELHPGKSAKVLFQNQPVGVLGELHPSMLKELGLNKSNAVVLELNLEPLLEAKVSIAKMSPISKFPVVTRDLALLVDKKVASSEIIRSIKYSGKGLVKDVRIFDVYMGEGIADTLKSVAVSITFGKEGTLTDKEITDQLDKIKYDLAKNLKAELRM